MRDTITQTLLDLKAQQENGEHMMCPRCGQDTMDAVVQRNALSRHVDIHICADCGTAEAMLKMMQNPLPIGQWACFKDEQPLCNFDALPGAIVLERLKKEQISYLIGLFERWQEEQMHEDFEAYRRDAHRKCAGLSALWSQPFQAAYKVADGQLLIRFRMTEDCVEVASDLIS